MPSRHATPFPPCVNTLLELAAGYLRQSILETSGIDEEAKEILLKDYFKLPYNESLHSSLHGELIGNENALDATESFPDVEWESEPFQLGSDREEDATIGFRTRVVGQSMPLGITFTPVRIGMAASPAMTEGTEMRFASSQAGLAAEGSGPSWIDELVGGRPASSIQISDLFANPVKTDGKSGISFDEAFEYHVETTTKPNASVGRADLLRSAQRVRGMREAEGWELLCALPGSDENSMSLVYRRAIEVE